MPRSLPHLPAVRATGAAAVLVLAAWSAGPTAQAGEASSSFAITINVLPEGAGTCSASTSGGAPQVTCRPTLGGVVGAGAGADGRPAAMLLGYRPPDAALRLAGEMIEIGNENHYAWTEPDRPDMATPEYSTELVSADGRDFVRYTVSW